MCKHRLSAGQPCPLGEVVWGFNEQEQFYFVCNPDSAIIAIKRPRPGLFEVQVDYRKAPTEPKRAGPIVIIEDPLASRTTYIYDSDEAKAKK